MAVDDGHSPEAVAHPIQLEPTSYKLKFTGNEALVSVAAIKTQITPLIQHQCLQ
jgi:hypothetical protein